MAERFAPHVNDQRAALLGVLNGCTDDDWGLPTPCGSWSVHDVVAHLVENELLFGRLYRGELADFTTDTQAGVDRWAKVDGETARYSLWHHGQATQRVIDSRSDESWRRPIERGGVPLELRHALRLHFFELAVHGHDVTTALGHDPVWHDRAGTVVEYCLRGAPRALERSNAPPDGAFVVRAPEVGARTIDGTSGAWRLVSEPVADPTATWDADAETLVLATTGRMAVADALGRSTVGGDAARLEAMLAGWQVTR